MIIKSLEIKNIKSFGEQTKFYFDEDYSILIGPNGSGKSNLLEVFINALNSLVLKYYFQRVDLGNNLSILSIVRTSIEQSLYRKIFSKHYDFEEEDQRLSFSIKFTSEDIKNAKKCVEILPLLKHYFEQETTKIQNIDVFLSEYTDIINNLQTHANSERDIDIDFQLNSSGIETTGYADQEKQSIINYFKNIEKFNLIVDYYKRTTLDHIVEIPESPIIYLGVIRNNNFEKNIQLNINSEVEVDTSSSRNQSSNIVNATNKDGPINYSSFFFRDLAEKYYYGRLLEQIPNAIEHDIRLTTINKYLENYLNIRFKIIMGRPPHFFTCIFVDTNSKKEIDVNSLSSGEKELINFIFSLVPYINKNSLFIIDEPELHLHKKYQNLLLDLFNDLAKMSQCQYILSTHSPSFINTNTISKVIRIYKDKERISRKIKVKKEELNSMKDLLHIVSSQNNEKIFFADKVVLVEGITDRLVVEKLIELIGTFTKCENNKVIEVIETGSKHNLVKYRQFLDCFMVDNYIIADFDYLKQMGDSKTKALFTPNKKDISQKLLKEISTDSDNLIDHLKIAIKSPSENLESFKKFLEYLETRKIILKETITQADINYIKSYTKKLFSKKIFVFHKNGLKHKIGALEDYLPFGFQNKQVEDLTKLLNNKFFCNIFFTKDDGREVEELVSYVLEILDVGSNLTTLFFEELEKNISIDKQGYYTKLVYLLQNKITSQIH